MRDQLLGDTTAGVWTTADAIAAGLSEQEIAGRVEAGLWQRLRRGVFCDGGVVASPRMRGWAAVLAAGGVGHAYATGRTTLRLLALPLIDDDDPATEAADLVHDDVVVLDRHRSRATLHPVHRQVPVEQRCRIGGCPSLQPVAAMVDAARVLSLEALVCVLDAALHRELVTPESLHALVAASAGCRGVHRLRMAVALADGRAEAPTETLGRLLLQPLVPGLTPQVQVCDRSARPIARLDLGDERLRLAVEADGRSTHTGMAADDHRRDRRVGAFGWHTERYTWFEVRRQPAALQARILAVATRLERRAA
ncbi:MAG: hypothetical protein QOK42_852 [Frankiaceae bacterium]|jgi:hypothetical protein|nr:hypothetical protein [Frankiaceae bacterium]